MMENLSEYIMNMQTELGHSARAGENAQEREFVSLMCNDMEKISLISGPVGSHYEGRGVKISAWCYDGEDNVDIIVADWKNRQTEMKLTENQMETTFTKAITFIKRAFSTKLYEAMEESGPAYDIAYTLFANRKEIKEIRIYLITDAVCTISSFDTHVHEDRVFKKSTWDMRDRQNYELTGKSKSISVNFEKDFGEGIPCTQIDSDDRYETYLAFVPGIILARLYEKWDTKLLDMNVRVFLQSRSKINKGIKQTIIDEPEMFLAYNNGITVFSRDVEVKRKAKSNQIVSATDFQIVNGGQTTASIYYAWKDGADLRKINVQMKLTVISDQENVEGMAAKISEFSNTQNRVSAADFKARNPPHPQIQEVSKIIWAPDPTGGNNLTHWFYESKRGDYNEAKNRNFQFIEKEKFNAEYPPTQKFDKMDLGRWRNLERIRPWMISRGAQKNFLDYHEFALQTLERIEEDYPLFFRNSVALGIIWKESDKIVKSMQFDGYKINIVAYALASIFQIARVAEKSLDLEKIWNKQEIEGPLKETVKFLSKYVHEHITEDTNRNVSEWCKSELCWKKWNEDILSHFPESVLDGIPLIDGKSEYAGGMESTTREAIKFCLSKSAKEWYALSTWGANTKVLGEKHNSQCNTMGRFRRQKREPSERLAIPCAKAWKIASEQGWDQK